MHRSRRSSTSEDSSPPSNPRRRRRSRSHSQSSARSSRSFVDLNCSQESTQFPEETPPSASSSPAPDYGATDLRMRDPQFRRQTMGGAAPPAASNKSPSKGATGGKLTPVDLSVTGRKTSSKSSSLKSSKICPYCTDSPGENLRRHAYGVHVPWYMDPTRVCWTCLQSFKQPSMLEAHRVQCAEGSFQRHAATWAPRITTFFRTVTQELSLPSMEDLVPFVTQNYRMLPRSHALDPQDQEVMKLFELNRGTYPSQRRIYQANPPKCLAELIQWRIIGGLLSLVSPQARIDLMETPTGVQVTSREDAPPQPSQQRARPPPPPPTGPPPSTKVVPPAIKKMLKVTSHSSASATPARPSTETSASPAPLMSLRVSRRPDQPSRLAASSSGAAARLSTTAPPSKTRIVESTSGATLKVSVPNTPQEDPPALEDVTPCIVPTPYLAADAHCHLQQLVGYGETRYASLEAALAVEVPHAIRINPLVPSYCWPNTWEDILQPRPREARYIALGWHPTQAALRSDALLDQFRALLVTPDVVALGEVGLDYNRISYMEEPHQTKARQQQQELLEIMCREAKTHHLPLVLHCRDVGRAESATNDCLDILQRVFYHQREQLEWPIYLHCFNYGMDVALRWTSIFAQVYFGISPLLLNAQRCHEELPRVVRNIPREKILLETDSPYLPAPAAEDAIPSPAHVYHVAERVKALRNEVSIQAVLGAGREATMRFYRI